MKQTKEHVQARIDSRRKNGWWANPEKQIIRLTQYHFKEGHVPWNRGKHYTYEELCGGEKGKELRELRRVARTGYKYTKETKQKMSLNNARHWKGKEFPKESKLKRSQNAKINPNYGMKGKYHTDESKLKMSNALKGKTCYWKGKKRPELSGINHPMYGKHHIEGIRQKISLTTKLAMIRPEIREKIQNTQFKKGEHPHPETEFKKGQMALEKHHNWKGGKSFEPYGLGFNDRFKESIRERDNYCCVICNRMQEELGELLSIHHIDYNKINNFQQNCVSLCRNHHTDTNYNRQHWKTFFQSVLKERYSYEYTEDQKIILDFMECTINTK